MLEDDPAALWAAATAEVVRWAWSTDVWIAYPTPFASERGAGRRRGRIQEQRPSGLPSFVRVGLDTQTRIVASELFHAQHSTNSRIVVRFGAGATEIWWLSRRAIDKRGVLTFDSGRPVRLETQELYGGELIRAVESYRHDGQRLVEICFVRRLGEDERVAHRSVMAVRYDADGELLEIAGYEQGDDVAERPVVAFRRAPTKRRGRERLAKAAAEIAEELAHRLAVPGERDIAAVALSYDPEGREAPRALGFHRHVLDSWGLALEHLNPAEWSVPEGATDLSDAVTGFTPDRWNALVTEPAMDVASFIDEIASAVLARLPAEADILIYGCDIETAALERHLAMTAPPDVKAALGLRK